MKTQKRAIKITRTRRYRETKKRAYRPKAIFILDKGNVEQRISLSFPEKTREVNVEIPKEYNPEARSFWVGDLRFYYYIKDDKGFIYNKDGDFCAKFDKFDLKRAFKRIGAILKEKKKHFNT